MGGLGWYRKITSNYVVNSFRNPISRTNYPLFHTSVSSSPICYHVTHPRCSAIKIQCGIRQDHRLSPFISSVSTRYYSVDFFMNVVLMSSAVLINIYRRFETVPFTNRSRFVFWSRSIEKLFGDVALDRHQELLLFKRQILPASRPESVRVRLIANNIINGLQRNKEKKAWIDVAYASPISKPNTISWYDLTVDDLKSHWNNEAGDVNWVQNCRKKARYWKKPTTNHMKTFNWEILLLKDCTDFTSFSLLGGKILISTQFLDNVSTDDEIAVILGHEVAHVLARHIAEKMAMYVWADIIDKIRSLFGLRTQDRDNNFLWFSRNVEVEADYIGLLLMASAGYDPRVAPEVYKKLDDIHGSDSQLDEFECRFAAPSGERRSRLLAEPKVMEEALLMYHEATAGRGD